MSVGNRTARIQRSTPKRTNLDVSTHPSQHLNLTISTHTNSTNRRIQQNRCIDSKSTPHSSKHQGLSLSLKPQEKNKSPKHSPYSPSHIKSVKKVIDFE